MKKKLTTKKLVLAKETLRELNSHNLGGIATGAWTEAYACYNTSFGFKCFGSEFCTVSEGC